MNSCGYSLLALSQSGEVWRFESGGVERLETLWKLHGPMTEVSIGFQVFAARRASDRRWMIFDAEGNGVGPGGFLGGIIDSLGPNVESLVVHQDSAVWIETPQTSE